MPRPPIGFVTAHASPTVTTPVATGAPSTTKLRYLSAMVPMGITSVIGSPSSQWACSGHAATTVVHRQESRSAFNTGSPEKTKKVTDHVRESPGRVSSEKDW